MKCTSWRLLVVSLAVLCSYVAQATPESGNGNRSGLSAKPPEAEGIASYVLTLNPTADTTITITTVMPANAAEEATAREFLAYEQKTVLAANPGYTSAEYTVVGDPNEPKVSLQPLNEFSRLGIPPADLAEAGIQVLDPPSPNLSGGSNNVLSSNLSDTVRRQLVKIKHFAASESPTNTFLSVVVGTAAGAGQYIALTYTGVEPSAAIVATVLVGLYELAFQFKITPIMKYLNDKSWWRISGEPGNLPTLIAKNYVSTVVLSFALRVAFGLVKITPDTLSLAAAMDILSGTGVIVGVTSLWYKVVAEMASNQRPSNKKWLQYGAIVIPATLTVIVDAVLALDFIDYKFGMGPLLVSAKHAWAAIFASSVVAFTTQKLWHEDRQQLPQLAKKFKDILSGAKRNRCRPLQLDFELLETRDL